jgi:YHS domain-containing protein
MKVIDPVCEMTIDWEKAAATSEYEDKTIYFCAKGCKSKFDAAPDNTWTQRWILPSADPNGGPPWCFRKPFSRCS